MGVSYEAMRNAMGEAVCTISGPALWKWIFEQTNKIMAGYTDGTTWNATVTQKVNFRECVRIVQLEKPNCHYLLNHFLQNSFEIGHCVILTFWQLYKVKMVQHQNFSILTWIT